MSDGKEVNVYHTNPLATDTDSDGYLDGDEVALSSDPSDPDSHPLVVIADGDINNDGNVDTGDLILMQRIVLGKGQFTAEQLQHADVAPLVNGVPDPDGNLNAGDLVVLTRKVLGMIKF